MTTPLDSYLASVPADKTSLTDDERIENIVPLPPPEHLIRFFPIQGTPVESLISETRRSVRQILHGRGDRLLVVMGPCSIHDPLAALEYAGKLQKERRRHGDELELLMRVYFEKPRARSTISCRCTRAARWRSCRRAATTTATSSCAAAGSRTMTRRACRRPARSSSAPSCRSG